MKLMKRKNINLKIWFFKNTSYFDGYINSGIIEWNERFTTTPTPTYSPQPQPQPNHTHTHTHTHTHSSKYRFYNNFVIPLNVFQAFNHY